MADEDKLLAAINRIGDDIGSDIKALSAQIQHLALADAGHQSDIRAVQHSISTICGRLDDGSKNMTQMREEMSQMQARISTAIEQNSRLIDQSKKDQTELSGLWEDVNRHTVAISETQTGISTAVKILGTLSTAAIAIVMYFGQWVFDNNAQIAVQKERVEAHGSQLKEIAQSIEKQGAAK